MDKRLVNTLKNSTFGENQFRDSQFRQSNACWPPTIRTRANSCAVFIGYNASTESMCVISLQCLFAHLQYSPLPRGQTVWARLIVFIFGYDFQILPTEGIAPSVG